MISRQYSERDHHLPYVVPFASRLHRVARLATKSMSAVFL
jgi:hypothetical protein